MWYNWSSKSDPKWSMDCVKFLKQNLFSNRWSKISNCQLFYFQSVFISKLDRCNFKLNIVFVRLINIYVCDVFQLEPTGWQRYGIDWRTPPNASHCPAPCLYSQSLEHLRSIMSNLTSWHAKLKNLACDRNNSNKNAKYLWVI